MQKKKNIASPSTTQHHDTPNNKTHFIKFRVTEIEKMELEHTAKLLNLSLSTLIRRALHNVKIEKKIIVANSGEETLTAVSTLLAQCSRVGGNLNQLARHFNSGGADTEQIRAKILDELADLTAFRLHPPGWIQPLGKHPCPHRDRQRPNTRSGAQALYVEAPRLARGHEALQHRPDHAAPPCRGHGTVRGCWTVPDRPTQRLERARERGRVLDKATRTNET